MNNNQISPSSPLLALASTLALGFKFLAWINGLGIAAILSLGVFQLGVAPQWLRLPLAAFLGGLVLAALGLLWSYSAQISLLNQAISGRARRWHWIPLFCTMLAYSLSLLAFVCGCWLTLGLAGAVYQNTDDDASLDDESPSAEPFDQRGEGQDFIYNAQEKTIRFFGASRL